MKGKKLLAGVLSAAMVLGTMVLPAFADDEATELPAADENGVITLTEDVTLKGSFNISDNLDLGGHSLTIDNVTSVIKNGTIKNGTIKVAQNANSPETMLRIGDYSHASLEVEMKDVTIDAQEDYTASCGLLGIYQESKLTLNHVTINVGSNDGVAVIYGNDQKADLIANDINITAVNQNKLIYGVKDADIKNMTFKGKVNKDLFSVVGGKVKDSTFTYTNAENEDSRSITSDEGLEKELTFINTKIENAPTFTKGAMNNTGINSKVVADDLSTVNGDKMVDIADAKLAVAQIGDKYYTSLKDAIAAAQDGDTVTLANDVTESIKIDEGKAITLDLNGKTLTNTDGKHTIENYGALVVEDGSQDKTGKVDNITNGRISFVNYEGGVATLNGGSFDRSLENGKVGATDKGCNSCYTIKNWGIMTINENVSVNNNTDSQGGSSAIGNGYQNGANFDKHTNVTSANVKLTINGGKFTGGLNTIKNDDWAILEVHGGVFENNTQQCIMNWNKATITGGIFTGEPNAIYNGYDNDSMDKGILEITGGEFNGKIQVYDVNKKGKTSISGGTFNTDVSNYCAPGFSLKLVNGKYVVDDSADTLKLTFKKHTDDERVYDIVLNGDGKDINRLNTVHFTFALDNPNMTYAIKTAKGMSTIYPDNNEYVFYYYGKDGFGDTDRPDTAQNITIGTVTFDGFGKFTFKATAGKATATTTTDNLVTEFVTTGEAGKGTLKIGDAENMIKDAEIKVPTQKLTVNVAMEHNVGDNTEAYQDMTLAISGGDLAGKVLEYKLGDAENTAITKAMNGAMVASYQIKADLTKDRIYTVTVSGAGYRTSRYTVTMTEDKTMNFWNNDKTNEVTVIDDEKAKTTFLAGELVRDGKIDIYDLSAVVAYFGQKNIDKTQASKFAKYDLNRDGKIDIMDISIVLTSWGK